MTPLSKTTAESTNIYTVRRTPRPAIFSILVSVQPLNAIVEGGKEEDKSNLFYNSCVNSVLLDDAPLYIGLVFTEFVILPAPLS